jgi:precorrin-6B methylase 1
MQHKLWLVGGGSGQPDYLLPIARKTLEQADCVIASERFLSMIQAKKNIAVKTAFAVIATAAGFTETGIHCHSCFWRSIAL